MKKLILLITNFLLGIRLYGMDQPPRLSLRSVSYSIGKTIIKITKQKMGILDGLVDAFVIPEREQRRWRQIPWVYIPVGDMRLVRNNTILVKNKENKIEWKTMKSPVLSIAEPVNHGLHGRQDCIIDFTKKESAICYETILTHIAECEDFKNKSTLIIAIPAFFRGTGITREEAAVSTIQAIVAFLKKNPDRYSLIYLFVKRTRHFDLYKNILENENQG